MSAREEILQRVKQACPTGRTTLPAQVPPAPVRDRLELFARELETLGGELIVAGSPDEAAARLRELIPRERLWFIADRPLVAQVAAHLPVNRASWEQMADCAVSVTEADWVIADTATVGLGLDASQPRSCHLLPEAHVVVATRERMRLTLADALVELEEAQELPTGYVFVTGPSRTADIEKTVVIPAHGPKRLIVVLLP